MNITFELRKDLKDKKGLLPLRLVIISEGNRFRQTVKNVKVQEKNWKNYRIKPNLKSEPYNSHIEYNKILDDLENKFNLAKREMLLKENSIDFELFVENFKNNQFQSQNEKMDFFKVFVEFIEIHKSSKSVNTTKKYITALNFYRDFQSYENNNITFENINSDFYEDFRNYAFNERHTLNNYFGKLIDNLKTFLQWAYEKGYHNNLYFKKFNSVKNSIEVIYLTMDELMKLYQYDFESNRLKHVRDFYCFGCFTGLRFSDIMQLRASNIQENHLLINIQKTKTIDHVVPLNNFAKEILKRYKGTLFEPIPKISGQKFNVYIKECCQIVGIDTPVNTTRYIGNQRIDLERPKYELITSHTAKKTFVTNSLILGMKEQVIREITGNKDEASFRPYLKIANDLKNNEMQNTWNKIKVNE